MPRVSTSIKLSEEEKGIIRELRELGGFENASEVVRFAIRKLLLDYKNEAFPPTDPLEWLSPEAIREATGQS